jgi:hypothetical protein
LISGSSQVSYTGLSNVPAGIVSSSAQVGGYGVFATTGSNGFNGSQAITGSLTVTGQVVAQTLNVQQVTSSIVYSSGSNIFGNSLGNTQQFTGSVSVTGSLTSNGALSGTSAAFSGNVSLNTSNIILGLGNGANNESIVLSYNSNASSRSWRIIKDWTAFGDFQIQQSTTQTGTTYADILRFSPAGAANFSNSLRIQGSTVPSSGSGTELAWDGTNGYLLAFNRTTSTYLPLFVQGSSLSFTGAATFASSVNVNGLATSANYKLGTTGAAFISGANNKGVFITDNASYASIVGLNSAISAYNSIELRASGVDGQLFLHTNGNVGIGTTSPGNFNALTFTSPILDVIGSLNVRGIAANGASVINIGGETYRKAAIFTSIQDQDPFLGFSVGNGGGTSSSTTERMRITSDGYVLIGETNPPTFSTPSGGKLLMLPNAVIVSGIIALGSPYTQNIQIDIVYNNWGGNNVIGLVDMIITLREFANVSGTAFGKVFATNSGSGSTFASFNTTNITTSQCSVTATSGGNYTLRITIDPSNVTDRGSFYLTIPNAGGTGSTINSIVVSYV